MPSSLFHRACESGDIEVAKKELLKEKKLTLDIIGQSFTRACFEGQLELAKWILDLSPNKSATIDFEMQEPIFSAQRNRQLEVAQWLVSLKPLLTGIRPSPKHKFKVFIRFHHSAFRHACLTGDLEGAKWILSDRPRMRISKMEWEELFGVACLKGHLEVAQWLLVIKPKFDIHADRDFALRSAKKHKQTHIIEWLSTF